LCHTFSAGLWQSTGAGALIVKHFGKGRTGLLAPGTAFTFTMSVVSARTPGYLPAFWLYTHFSSWSGTYGSNRDTLLISQISLTHGLRAVASGCTQIHFLLSKYEDEAFSMTPSLSYK
jgi:hypothetical protein